jgi:hypothetical protein
LSVARPAAVAGSAEQMMARAIAATHAQRWFMGLLPKTPWHALNARPPVTYRDRSTGAMEKSVSDKIPVATEFVNHAAIGT